MSPDKSAALDKAALYRAVVLDWAAESWADGDRDVFEPRDFPAGGAVTAPGAEDGEVWGWAYPSEQAGLGGVLAWADRHDVASLFVLADVSPDGRPGLLARQAQWFARPEIEVYELDRSNASAVPADAADLPVSPPVDLAGELAAVLAAAGLEIVVEGGVVRGEVAGLEVARIVDGSVLEVGVGAADRELTAMLHGGLTPDDQVARAADIVREHRVLDAARHPLNQLVRERWLRSSVCRTPETIGLRSLRPADTPWPRLNLVDRGVAAALGETAAGAPVVVACSIGIDLELVPRAADIRAALDPSAELWLVVPERDDHPLTGRLAAQLHNPARVVTVAWP